MEVVTYKWLTTDHNKEEFKKKKKKALWTTHSLHFLEVLDLEEECYILSTICP